MADLKLTVDISALSKAQSAVKALEGKTVNVKLNAQGIDSLSKGLSSAATTTKGISANVAQLGNAVKTVTTATSNGTTVAKTYQETLGKTKTVVESIANGQKTITKETTKLQDVSEQELTNLGKKKSLIQSINKVQTQSLSKYANQSGLSNLLTSTKGLDTTSKDFESNYKTMAQSLSAYKSEAQSAKFAQDQLTQANKKNLLSVDNIKESMATAAIRTVEWAVTMGTLYGAVNAVKSMVTTSSAIYDQMNSIQMVTGASNSEISSMLTTYQEIASTLSSTTSQVAASAEVWLRQGRSIADTNSLIETTTVLSKVGFMDSATSAQMLTSAINGYKISAEDAMSVVDKMSAIDVAAATSTEDLAIAMSETASGAKIAGVSMDELLSYIAAIDDVTQAGGDVIGNSLKTIFARINNVKLGSLTDEDGSDISNVETVLKQYGITLRETNGVARDTGYVLDELSTKWSSLTNLEKSEIATQFAGVRQKEKFLVLMENYNKVLEYQEVAARSAGSSMEKMSIWEESTAAATERLSNQWEILSTNMVDSNITKAFINLGTLSLKALNTDIGQLIVKFGMLAAASIAVQAAMGKMSSAWALADVTKGTGLVASIKSIVAAQAQYKALKTATEGAAAAQLTFAEGSMAASVAQNGLLQTLKASMFSFAGVATMVAAGAALITWGYDQIVTTYSEHLENINNMQTEISDNATEMDSITSEIEENTSRIAELNAQGALSSDNQSELSYLESTNQQLQIKLESLKAINEELEKSVSQEAVDTLTEYDDKYSLLIGMQSLPAGFSPPALPSGFGDAKGLSLLTKQFSQLDGIQQKFIELAKNKDSLSVEDYVGEWSDLKDEQQNVLDTTSQTYAEISDVISNINPGDSEAGDALLAQFDALTEQWHQIGLDTGLIQSDLFLSNSEQTSQFNGATAQSFSDMSEYIATLNTGLTTGLTETSDFRTALLTLFSDTNPPTDLVSSLDLIGTLFSQDEENAGVFLDTLNQFKTESGNFNLKAMQDQFQLSDIAMATINSRLNDMGQLMSTSVSDGVLALGNGLGLASDDATEFEMQLNKMAGALDDNTMSWADAESYIRDYLSSMGVLPGKIEQVVDDFSMLTEGASEFNLLAFTGLTGDGELAGVSQQAESIAQEYVSTFTGTLQTQLSNGTESGALDFSGLDVNADGLKEKISGVLRDSGQFTDDQIAQLSEQISSNTIQASFNVVADGVVSELNIENADVASQVDDIIQSSFDTTTQQFNVDSAVAQISDIQVEGVDSATIASAVQEKLDAVNTQIGTAKLNVETTETVNLNVNDNGTTDKLNEVNSLSEDKTKNVSVNFNDGGAISSLNTINSLAGSVTKNVYVNTIQTTTTKNATGHISLNTANSGNESLVGEEGEETLIRNGVVSYIGTNGAEIIPIQDGDTILPADITKRIKSGSIPMYADGKYNVTTDTSPVDTSWYTAFRANSSIWSGLAGDEPEDDTAKKAYQEHIKLFQKEFDYYSHLLDMGELSEADYYAKVQSLNEQYFAGKNEYLDEYRQHEKEVYDFLKKQEEERLQTLEESYSASTDYVLGLLDDQIEALQEQEDLVDQQEKLADKQQELADKQEELDNISNNKNQRVYIAGVGWDWQSDQEAVNKAQEELDDIQKEIDDMVEEMTTQTDSEKLQEYRDLWADIVDNYENEQNKIDATNLLGEGFEDLLLSGDYSLLRDFASNYSDVLGDIDNLDGDTSIPLLDYANAFTDSSGGLLTSALASSLAGSATMATSTSTTSAIDNSISIDTVTISSVDDLESFITELQRVATTYRS